MPVRVSEREYRQMTGQPEPEPEVRIRAPRVREPRLKTETHVRREAKVSFDPGYWGFVSAVIFIFFLMYIAGKGEIKQWLDVLIWNPAQAPKAQGSGQSPGGLPPPGAIGGAMTKPGGGAAPFTGPFMPPGGIISAVPGYVTNFVKSFMGSPTGQGFFGGGPPV